MTSLTRQLVFTGFNLASFLYKSKKCGHFVHLYSCQWQIHTHTHLQYTQTHSLAEEFNKAALAVGLVILLLERAFVQLLEAESAHKVFWVKLLAHSRDAAAGDGFLAARAQRAAPLMVVRLAVGLAIMVKEAAVYEWSEALLEKSEGMR